jgi:ADP-ribose pyrophosphatase YjhB (NUDIX family)
MAHIHEKIDLTVGAFIVYKNTVLLRMHDKYHMWLAVGGHVELDEDPNQAILREVKEEVGLEVELWEGNMASKGAFRDSNDFKELIPPIGMNIHKVSETHQHMDMLYFATATTDTVVPESPNDEWKWLTMEELEAMPGLLPDIKLYAKLALETLGE